jgi:iduronate 2-sulfatase
MHALLPGLRYFIAVVGVVLASSAARGESTRPNVLFIIADDLNNQVGCYGSPVKTPTIDELAGRGMRFDRAYCQNPLCNPSRVSFLSGLRPDKTRVYTLSTHTREYLGDWVMLPEYFRKNGYFTVQVGKIYHTDDGFEDPRSWDVEIRESGKKPSPKEIVQSRNPAGPTGHSIGWASLNTPDEKTPDGIVARTAAKYIEQAVAAKKPFFLGAGFRRPHAPYAAPKKYFDMYPPDSIRLSDGRGEKVLPAAVNYQSSNTPMSDREEREVIAAYYACTSFVDAQVKVLFDTMDRLHLWDNTIVVFIGDHGYQLGEHGLWHKLSLFEESARVPMIIYAPGMKAKGKSSDQLVEFIDLYPTLVSLCGLPHREGLDGIDLTAVLNNPAHHTKDAAYTVVSRTTDVSRNPSQTMDYLGRSVRTSRWRYTEWDGGKRGSELYDHDADPHESHNLAGDQFYTKVISELHRLLSADAASSSSAGH